MHGSLRAAFDTRRFSLPGRCHQRLGAKRSKARVEEVTPPMQVPTVPLLSQLSKAHKFSAAGMAAAGVGVLAITGAASGGATKTAAAADTATVQRVAAWTPDTVDQQESLSLQARTAEKNAQREADAERTAAKADALAKARALAEKRKKQREASAPRSAHRSSLSGTPREIARRLIGASAQFQCFSNIVSHESGWDSRATNASSGAYGLVQALPGSKMASAGSDWRTNPVTQIEWGLDYMNSRYGSPCAAWSFWQAHNWY